MNEDISIVNLKCLNCGANLQLTESISEFACQHCGASQIVLRKGGVITLELISDKIDCVQNSINKTSAELKIQRLNSKLKELDAIYSKLETSLREMKSMINPVAITIIAFVGLSFFIISAFTGSFIPLIAGGILCIILIGIWRKKINNMDSEFFQSKMNLDQRAMELKEEIANLEKITEYP